MAYTRHIVIVLSVCFVNFYLQGVEMSQVSVFRTVGQGRIDGNKPITNPDGSFCTEAEIIPTEWIGMRDGEMTQNATVMEYETKDQDGVSVKGAIVGTNTIKAQWLPGACSNRLTPPDVRRGVRVEILQAADEDKYYWRDMGLDHGLFKLETIIIGISNTQNENANSLAPENMYWIEFSTHSKRLAFCTSKSDGEPFLYEMYFDTKKGEFNLTDDVGNLINLVSALSLIHLQNDKGTFVKLDKKDIKMFAPQDLIANVTRDLKITTGNNGTVNIGKSFKLTAGTDVLIDGGGSTYKSTAGNVAITSPTVDINKG